MAIPILIEAGIPCMGDKDTCKGAGLEGGKADHAAGN